MCWSELTRTLAMCTCKTFSLDSVVHVTIARLLARDAFQSESRPSGSSSLHSPSSSQTSWYSVEVDNKRSLHRHVLWLFKYIQHGHIKLAVTIQSDSHAWKIKREQFQKTSLKKDENRIFEVNEAFECFARLSWNLYPYMRYLQWIPTGGFWCVKSN